MRTSRFHSKIIAKASGCKLVDDLANNLIDAYFNGHGLFDTIELYKEIRKEDVEKIISDSFKEEFCCLSVIK